MVKSKPKVLFIMHMPPPVHGAAVVGKFIHDSKTVNDSFDCRYENMMLAGSLEDIGKGGIRKVLNLFAQLKRFEKTIKEFQPDLVYITPNAVGGAFYKDFVVVQYVKHCLKMYSPNAQVVAHYHNKGVATRQNRFLDNLLYKIFFRRLKVILLANVLYEDLKKYVAKKEVSICPNGIPESLQEEPMVERNNPIPQILFLSNLIISKGVFVLLDALKILNERGLLFTCNFVGGETDEIDSPKILGEIEKRSLKNKVFFVGKKYGDEKRQYFENANIFIHPSFNDAYPLVIIEAMEYKLPIVTTDEGGIPDMIVNGVQGLICERKNPVALADAIEVLLKDKTLRVKMGECGYKKFKSEYTLAIFEKRIVSILEEILAEESRL